ncbi:unnamed protein product [Rhizophagus irregularis]|nr:unnamed protein product [Rhizophagus irregularis]
MKDNSHQIIKEQFELIDSTFSLMEETVNKLNNIEVKLDATKNEYNTTNAKINIMENNIKDLMDMKIQWQDIKESITDKYYYGIDASEKACIKKLVQILEKINMDFNEFKLLFEMNKESNGHFIMNGRGLRR